MRRSSLAVTAVLAIEGCGGAHHSHTRTRLARTLPSCAAVLAQDSESGRCLRQAGGTLSVAAAGSPARFGDVRLRIQSVQIRRRIAAGGGFGPLQYRRGRFVVVRVRVTNVGTEPLDFSATTYWRVALVTDDRIFPSFDHAALRLPGTGNSVAFPIAASRSRNVWLVFFVGTRFVRQLGDGLLYFIDSAQIANGQTVRHAKSAGVARLPTPRRPTVRKAHSYR